MKNRFQGWNRFQGFIGLEMSCNGKKFEMVLQRTGVLRVSERWFEEREREEAEEEREK